MSNYKLRVTPAMEKSFDYVDFDFDTKIEMEAAHNSMARLLIYLQDDLKVMYDFSNIFEQFRRDKDGKWIEIN